MNHLTRFDGLYKDVDKAVVYTQEIVRDIKKKPIKDYLYKLTYRFTWIWVFTFPNKMMPLPFRDWLRYFMRWTVK